jgi:hypothetical protein
MANKHLVNIILLFSLIFTSSCSNDEQCRKDRYIRTTAGIYQVTYDSTTKIRTTTLLSPDSISVQGLGVDSITDYKKKSSILFPLNQITTATESKFRVKFNQTVDTITILHTNYNAFLSLECGCLVTHSIDTVITTNHFIDSVRISVHDVNTSTSAKENIKIYN